MVWCKVWREAPGRAIGFLLVGVWDGRSQVWEKSSIVEEDALLSQGGIALCVPFPGPAPGAGLCPRPRREGFAEQMNSGDKIAGEQTVF